MSDPNTGKVASGIALNFPETSHVAEDAGSASVPPYDAAVAKAIDNPDIQTIFFINFPPNLAGSAKEAMKRVQEMVDKKALSAEKSGQFARGTYRTQILDYLMRRSNWFPKTSEQNLTRHIEVPKVEVHGAILMALLQGFSVSAGVLMQLENVVKIVNDGIVSASSSNTRDKQQYWIMLTRYHHEPDSGKVQPTIRVISFVVSPDMKKYIVDKSKYDSVEFDMMFGQYEADFNAQIYEKLQGSLDQRLISLGTGLVKRTTFDVFT